MATPRPPGVRRANDFEEQIAQRVTSLPALLAIDPVGSSGFAPRFSRSASATFWLAYARQNVAGRRPLRAMLFAEI